MTGQFQSSCTVSSDFEAGSGSDFHLDILARRTNHTLWRSRLRERLHQQPYPLFGFEIGAVPAGTIWAGARLWTYAFRGASLTPGDRLLLAIEPCPAFIQILVAAIWEGLTIAILPPPADEETLTEHMERLDARAAIADVGSEENGVWHPDFCEGPLQTEISPRPTRLDATPEARFLLRTSGSTGVGKWVALSDAGVLHVVDSHLPHLGLEEGESRVLSALPWHHAFGLVLELLPALFAGAELLRDDLNGKDPQMLLDIGQDLQATHLSLVPLTLKRLLSVPGGAEFVQSLQGGIVGGAPVDAELAQFLATTRLRAGYGQTEASPGITLGNAGEWHGGHYLGHPLGCETRVDDDGVLHFQGVNMFLGYWKPETGLTLLPEDRWVNTGDIVETLPDGGLRFMGRVDDAFKLANGKRVEAGYWESVIKQRYPQVREAFLTSPDGIQLRLYTLFGSEQKALSVSEAQDALQGLGSKLAEVFSAPDTAWVYTAKGVLNRNETLQRLLALPQLEGAMV
ncbi:MAG: class I adenylate-forming enzyme family protein [Armatimonadaceae bacterium]